MMPIRSFRAVCRDYGLNLSQTRTLRSLLDRRSGVLHPYWIQLALYVPYSLAERLYNELIANEWAVADEIEVDGTVYESELTEIEIKTLAEIELFR